MNIELNLTLRCQLKCWACNRLCGTLPYDENTDIRMAQINALIERAKIVKVDKIKILGGEPLMHPKFYEILEKLHNAQKHGLVGLLKVDTNHIIKPDDKWKIQGIKWMGKSNAKKKHYPIIHPADLGYLTESKPNCSMIKRCGIALEARGWLPCSAAIPIVRLWKLDHLYKQELPDKVWGLDELCHRCVWSMPSDWLNTHQYHLDKVPDEFKNPSKSYMEKLIA